MTHFSGVPRQWGRGYGAFASTVVRTVFNFLKRYFLPTAKRIGRDQIESAVSEIQNFVSDKSSVKKQLNNKLQQQSENNWVVKTRQQKKPYQIYAKKVKTQSNDSRKLLSASVESVKIGSEIGFILKFSFAGFDSLRFGLASVFFQKYRCRNACTQERDFLSLSLNSI